VVLKMILDASERVFTGACQRTFTYGTFEETLEVAYVTDRLQLKEYPVHSVTGITYYLNVAETDPEVLTDYRLRGDAGYLIFTTALPPASTVWVTYTAGYTPELSLPADIPLAIYHLGSMLRNQSATVGMKSESLGDRSYTVMDFGQGTGFPPLVQQSIDRYKRVLFKV